MVLTMDVIVVRFYQHLVWVNVFFKQIIHMSHIRFGQIGQIFLIFEWVIILEKELNFLAGQVLFIYLFLGVLNSWNED